MRIQFFVFDLSSFLGCHHFVVLIAKLLIVTLFSVFSVIWPYNCLAYAPNLLVSLYLAKNLF